MRALSFVPLVRCCAIETRTVRIGAAAILYIYTVQMHRTMGNTKSAAGCQAPSVSPATPTVRQVAQRLLDALDRLHAGTESQGFHGWENGLGEPAGDHLEEVRHELEVLLASTPGQSRLITGADFDPEAFERVWKSEVVQNAATSFGWRGLAEAVWAAAYDSPPAKRNEPPSSSSNAVE